MSVGLKVKNLRDILIDIKGKPVLVRADLNVPQDDNQSVTDATKLEAVANTVLFLSDMGAKVIVCSHLGRPDGKKNEKFSLRPVSVNFESVLKRPVAFIDDCIGNTRDGIIRLMRPGQIALLENLRFYEEEEKNDPEFASQLASGFACYVNEAFPASHRKHASIVEVPNIVGKQASFVGYNFQIEFENLSKFIGSSAGPVALVFGGAKVKDKIKTMRGMLDKADIFVTAGGIGNTFLRGLGYSIGNSLYEPDSTKDAKEIFKAAKNDWKDFVVPIDATVLVENGEVCEKYIHDVKSSDAIFDIGEETFHHIKDRLCDAKTVFWNGAFGKAEDPRFSRGTQEFGEFLAELSERAFVIIGGGDTSALISDNAKFRIIKNGGYISTSGGAAMEFLEKSGTLPGIQALEFA